MSAPTDAQLHADRLRAEFEASMTSRRARLAWRMAGLVSRGWRRQR